jgi:hypothetical protein
LVPPPHRQDGSNIGNGSVSNAQPYSHVSYDYQDVRMLYPQYNATLAHYAYAYDTYTGNSSYLQMQLWQNYKRTAGQDKVCVTLEWLLRSDDFAKCFGCSNTVTESAVGGSDPTQFGMFYSAQKLCLAPG